MGSAACRRRRKCLGARAQSARPSAVVVVVRLRLIQLLSGPLSRTYIRVRPCTATVIRDAFPSAIETPTEVTPTRDDGVHGERPGQTADGPEPVAAEHPDALALADTSQKAPPDHREDLVQGDVQRYGRPRENLATVLSAGSKRCSGLDDAVGRPERASTKFLNGQTNQLNADTIAIGRTGDYGEPMNRPENRLTRNRVV